MTQDWIPVGALGDAFAPDNNTLPPVADLSGKEICLHFENGWIIRHHFLSDDRLTWDVLRGEANPGLDTDNYVATCPRPGIYLVDFVKHCEAATSVSLVLDLENGVFIAVIGTLPDREEASLSMLERIDRKLELTGVRSSFLRGTLDRDFSPAAPLPQQTRDLIGKRIEYRYNRQENYEHIYLNDRSYSWHCLEGSERGLCDTDTCHYYKIGNGLYLFVWREKIVPTLGLICIDLHAMKTTGKILGYEQHDCRSIRNFGVGAFAKIVGSIAHHGTGSQA